MSEEAATALRRAHPVMDRAVEIVLADSGLVELEPRPVSPYEALSRAIVFQQLSGKAASTIHGRFLALFDCEIAPDPALLAETSEETLRGAGLSRNKALALKDLASRTLDGTVPDRTTCEALSDTELVARLSAVRGIGEWTAQMFLLFTLARPDVWPTGDLGVRKGWSIAAGEEVLPAPKVLEEMGAALSPLRSFAALYLWRVTDGQGGMP